MPGRTVRVRDADGREFEAMATDARRHGWEVIDEPQPTQTPAPEAVELETPAAEVVVPKKSSKSTQAAVIDSESAPTSEGTDR